VDDGHGRLSVLAALAWAFRPGNPLQLPAEEVAFGFQAFREEGFEVEGDRVFQGLSPGRAEPAQMFDQLSFGV
jgi:hypothetical protein